MFLEILILLSAKVKSRFGEPAKRLEHRDHRDQKMSFLKLQRDGGKRLVKEGVLDIEEMTGLYNLEKKASMHRLRNVEMAFQVTFCDFGCKLVET